MPEMRNQLSVSAMCANFALGTQNTMTSLVASSFHEHRQPSIARASRSLSSSSNTVQGSVS